jgi:sugar lactone lactonase YvrE
MSMPAIPIRGAFSASLPAILLVASAAHAQRAPPEAVHPRSYASPSGEFVLFVDPTDIHARGPASYRLTRAGRTAWEGSKPYSFHDAGVADDGTVAGYSYSNGLEGFPKDRTIDRTPGDLRAVILDPSGRERLDEATPRKPTRVLHGLPEPSARGLFIDPVNDRLVLRVVEGDENHAGETWWAFRLSSGKREPSTKIPADGGGWILAARHVPGTPLVLLHKWRYEYRPGGSRAGARFTLVDPRQETVWSLELPEDYNVPGDEKAQDRLANRIRRTGAIIGTREGGRFDLWVVRDARRVTFEARKEGEAWKVRELERSAHEEPRDEATAWAIRQSKLALLGEVKLEVSVSPASPVRDVISFDIDSRGRVGLTRKEGENRSTLLLLEADGKVVREIPLDGVLGAKDVQGPHLAWIDGDRWLAYLSPQGIEARSSAWWVDGSNGVVTRLDGLDCPSIQALDGTGDGAFVALGRRRFKYTSDSVLVAFDRDGKHRWSVENDPTDPKQQFRRDGVAVTSRGRLAVLSTVRKTVDLFDAEGKYLETLRLESAWKRKPNYPTRITADWQGGFIIEDFRGKLPAVWMGGEGDVRLELPPPRFEDGRAASLRDFRVAPDGGVWASDRSCIARVGEDGVIKTTLGSVPSSQSLDEVAAVTMDARGNIYLVEARMGAVHAFAPDGRRLRTSIPDPGDFPGRLVLSHATVDAEGNIYVVAGDPLARTEYVQFSPRGDRVGKKSLGLDIISEKWHAQPLGSNTWVVGHQVVYLVDPSGKPLREIRRKPDGDWLESIGVASVAPDGSLAVASSSRARERWDVNLYSAGGEPLRTIAVPIVWPSHLAFDGKRIVLQGDTDAWILDAMAEKQAATKVDLARGTLEAGKSWCFLPARSPAELWIVDGRAKSVLRFALP